MQLARGPAGPKEMERRNKMDNTLIITMAIGIAVIAIAVIAVAQVNNQRITNNLVQICDKLLKAQEDCYFEIRNDLYEVYDRIEKLEKKSENAIYVEDIMEIEEME